jgi:pimeloyl-ACP methyl ester carboxylesterase
MTILEQIKSFEQQYGKVINVNGKPWRYYRLGAGEPVFWLTGGLRRAAFGFGFLERLAERHTVVAPDYPPVQKIDDFLAAFDAMLANEGIGSFVLGGQSYGGMLAQAYLAHHPSLVEKLVISSSGPADFGRTWLIGDGIAIALARILPERTVKNIIFGGLAKLITVPESEREEWMEAFETIVHDNLTQADVISHFAVPADMIQTGVVNPSSYLGWPGNVTVLSAENDPTQSKKDIPRFERLFGRPVRVISMENMGHTAALFNPHAYVDLLEKALVEEL